MSKTEIQSGRLNPSLAALQTFEAAARFQSLTLAARELNVTVSAVAFQIRQVEESLGAKLIGRSGRGIDVSAPGQQLARELCDPFADIRRAVLRFRASHSVRKVVTASMLPGFAAMWLLPRMSDFERAHPEVDLRISTSERCVDLKAEDVDCAIRCGPGGWSGVDAEPLFPQLLAPICHRSYLALAGRPKSPFDLHAHKLILNTIRAGEWEEWFAAAAEPGACPPMAQAVEGRELVLAAVRAGLGIGLLDVSVLRREIAAGELVRIFDPLLETGWSHYFVTPSGSAPSQSCERFRSWMRSEAGVSS